MTLSEKIWYNVSSRNRFMKKIVGFFKKLRCDLIIPFLFFLQNVKQKCVLTMKNIQIVFIISFFSVKYLTAEDPSMLFLTGRKEGVCVCVCNHSLDLSSHGVGRDTFVC